MNFALIYLFNRFFYQLGNFFHHWYVDASYYFFHYFISLLERLDRVWAIRVTLKYFFQPLYKDYTIIGRIVGVIFRAGRIVIGLLIYLFVAALFIVIYLLWLTFPFLLLFYIGKNFKMES